MIWLILIVPIIAIIILALKFNKRTHYLEYASVLVIAIVAILIGKHASIHSQTVDKEQWNSHGTQAWFYEAWDEEVPCSHAKYRTEYHTDSNGNTYTTEVFDGWEHLYDVDYHPKRWFLHDNIGVRHSISQGRFEAICKLWNMRQFKDMNRDYHSQDGDAYYSDYDKVFEHTIPISVTHTYENKVQASKSVFNFQEVTPEDISLYKLFKYPNHDKFNYNPLFGYSDRKASDLLRWHNAHRGARRQIHMMLLVFNDETLDISHLQEAYWKGGNKNEFIVCVGKKADKIDWVRVISWTENDMLKQTTEREIREMDSFDAVKIAAYMGENVPSKFIRKEFADFSYLTIEPTMSAVIWTTVITIVLTIGMFIFIILNDFDLATRIGNGYRNRRRGRYNRY